MEETEEKKVLLVYKGVRLRGNGDVVYEYQNKADTKDYYAFGKIIGKHKTIGSLIEAGKTEDGVKGPYLFKGIDHKNLDLSDWRTANWAAEDLINARKAAERNKKGIENELNFIKAKYNKLHASQRSLFIASIVYELTK